jgi:hypothetical protein
LCHDLKLQTAFPRRVRESLYFSVIVKSAAIEDNAIHFFGAKTLGDCFADYLRVCPIGSNFRLSKKCPLNGRGSGQRVAPVIVHYLRVDMLPGKMNAKTRTFGRSSNTLSDSFMDALPRCFTKRGHNY